MTQGHGIVGKEWLSLVAFDEVDQKLDVHIGTITIFEPFAQLTGRSLSAATRTELAGGFNDYNPDFVYRYRKAPSLTVAELTDLSSHYLAQAQKWAEKAV